MADPTRDSTASLELTDTEDRKITDTASAISRRPTSDSRYWIAVVVAALHRAGFRVIRD